MPKLTVAAVTKIKPDATKRLEIPDSLLPGLYHVVQPSGVRSWCVRYRFAGVSRKLTLRGVPPDGLAKARQLARDALEAVADGRDPAAEKRRAQQAALAGSGELDTFGGAARTFIERYARPNTRSWQERARLLGLRPNGDPIPGGAVALWGERKLTEVSKRDVLGFLDTMVLRSGGTAANRTLSSIRRLYNWLIERDLITSSPCLGLKPPAAETSRDRVLSDEELRRVWHAAGELGYPFGPFVQLLILSGQRRTEVAGMERAEVNGQLWTIPSERTKNGQVHQVALSGAAVKILEALPRVAGPYVFSTTGKSHVSGYSRAKRLLEAKIGTPALPGWTLHDLRRTVASGLAQLKVPPHVIEATLNHKSGVIKGVGAIYNRYQYAAEKRAALEQWADYIQKITG